MSITKFIQIDNFFDDKEIKKLLNVVQSLPFVDKEYGKEIDQFQLVDPEINEVFSKVLNTKVKIDEENSGSFRMPELIIHFESFKNVTDWCFAIALEPTTFNTYRHIQGARSALDGHQYNYRNFLDWDYTTNILLEQNQCIFFRPWLFHSFSSGIIQMYRIEDDV